MLLGTYLDRLVVVSIRSLNTNSAGNLIMNRASKKGQALIEYILIVAIMAVLSFGFARFVGHYIYASALTDEEMPGLPSRVGGCISHGAAEMCERVRN
jgi:hypothetical protein